MIHVLVFDRTFGRTLHRDIFHELLARFFPAELHPLQNRRFSSHPTVTDTTSTATYTATSRPHPHTPFPRPQTNYPPFSSPTAPPFSLIPATTTTPIPPQRQNPPLLRRRRRALIHMHILWLDVCEAEFAVRVGEAGLGAGGGVGEDWGWGGVGVGRGRGAVGGAWGV